MMGNKSLTAGDRSSSILDRASSTQNQPLTEAQALTDQLVSVSIQEGTNLKTAAAMLGAGWVGRFTRVGAMTSLPGQAFARGASYVPALAAESAAFAGIERGFHPSSQPFQKDWARAAVTLTGLKAFGGMSRGQNVVLQHLFTDLGLVGGNHAASAIGLLDKPQGNFAQQMLQAEATNWHMKGSLAFAHGFSPRLSATEKSLEIFLKSQETNLFPEGQSAPFFSQFAMVASGQRGSFSVSHGEADGWKMASKKDEGGEGSGGEKYSGKPSILSRLVQTNPPRWKNIVLDPSFGLPGPKELQGLVDSARAGNKDAREALFKLDFEKLQSAAECFPEASAAISELGKDYRSNLRASVREFGTPENITKLNEAARNGNEEAAVYLIYLEMAQEKIRADYDPALTRKSFIAELCERMPEASGYFPELGYEEGSAGSSPSAKELVPVKESSKIIQEAERLHQEAVKVSHSAIMARDRGGLEAELSERSRAYELEKRASELMPQGETRTIYQLNAALLAMECKKFSEAEQLIKKALEENPLVAEKELTEHYMDFKIAGMGKKAEVELVGRILFDFNQNRGGSGESIGSGGGGLEKPSSGDSEKPDLSRLLVSHGPGPGEVLVGHDSDGNPKYIKLE